MTVEWLITQQDPIIYLDALQVSEMIELMNDSHPIVTLEFLDVFDGQPLMGIKAPTTERGIQLLGRVWKHQ